MVRRLWPFWQHLSALFLSHFPVSLILSNIPDCKGIKPVNPKGNQSCIFIGRIDTEAETPILWPTVVKNGLIGKGPDAGKDWRQEEKGETEGEMVGWHQQLSRNEFEQAPGSWWWTGKPGVLQSMGSERVRHNWATELNELNENIPDTPCPLDRSCSLGQL